MPAELIEACTSCSAMSMFWSRLNCMVMTDAPSELVEGMLRQAKLDAVFPIVPSVALATLQ